jgi:hypothetical protein
MKQMEKRNVKLKLELKLNRFCVRVLIERLFSIL